MFDVEAVVYYPQNITPLISVSFSQILVSYPVSLYFFFIKGDLCTCMKQVSSILSYWLLIAFELQNFCLV